MFIAFRTTTVIVKSNLIQSCKALSFHLVPFFSLKRSALSSSLMNRSLHLYKTCWLDHCLFTTPKRLFVSSIAITSRYKTIHLLYKCLYALQLVWLYLVCMYGKVCVYLCSILELCQRARNLDFWCTKFTDSFQSDVAFF